jgi:alpha-galactosidase
VWQIEHPGSWLWEVGDLREDLYLQVSGPTEAEHHWRQTLRPGERYTTVGVAVAVVDGDLTDGLRALTAYRRILRRPSADLRELPVIFNDYMNCLMGDPTEDALAPLIDVAADVGCDTFVIDAGWYSDDPGWWDTVGAWQPSTARFPSGLATTTQRIRDAGMVPGLWLEPEVIGVHSPIADELPDDAFFQVGGERIAENGRYHLDFRCDAVRAYLDAVVDRLVTTYGLGYFKLDYNINLPGTDGGARPGRPESPGAGLVGHGRAYLAWLDGVLDRHPDLVLENCASGGMRMDYAILSRLQLQSTSDQRDHLRYAAIAAAAPSAVTPEQSAVWAYPQPGHSPEEATFCLVNALLGRIHLSGRIDRMDPAQRERVRQALRLYKEYRPLLATGLPYWPLGLPGWYDGWLALAIAGERECLLAVWCREPGGGERTLRLPWLRTDGGSSWRVVPAFPTDLPTVLAWSPQDGDLRIALGGGPAARLLRFAR